MQSVMAVLVLGAFGVVAWAVLFRERRPHQRQRRTASTARRGSSPCPLATLIDLPGGAIRLIDVRGLPADELARGRVAVARDQVRLARPVAIQIWVLELATARAWLAAGATGLALLRSRLADLRTPDGEIMLHTSDGPLSPGEAAELRAAGLPWVEALASLTGATDLVPAPPTPWAASPDDRPVPRHDVLDDSLLIERFAFLDARRAHPEVDRLIRVLELAAVSGRADFIVWVFADWVIEQLSAAQVARIAAAIARTPATLQHRLAVVQPGDAPPPPLAPLAPLATRCGALAERVELVTADGTFNVAPIDLLHDAYFTVAWKGM